LEDASHVGTFRHVSFAGGERTTLSTANKTEYQIVTVAAVDDTDEISKRRCDRGESDTSKTEVVHRGIRDRVGGQHVIVRRKEKREVCRTEEEDGMRQKVPGVAELTHTRETFGPPPPLEDQSLKVSVYSLFSSIL
jgi:hypothetical protein